MEGQDLAPKKTSFEVKKTSLVKVKTKFRKVLTIFNAKFANFILEICIDFVCERYSTVNVCSLTVYL